MGNLSEKDVEVYLKDQIKILGGKAYKFVSPGNRGVPDRLICLPGSVNLFIEAKAPGEESTPQQLNRQREIRKLGNYVDVIDTKEKVDRFIIICKKILKIHALTVPLGAYYNEI